MSTNLFKRSVRLTTGTWAKIRERAAAKQVSESEFIREALDTYFTFIEGKAFDARRLAVICEYTQLVADEWLKQHAPERRDEIIDAVDVRLEKYHGG